MSGCFNLHFNRPEWLDLENKRNMIASIAAGTFFALGWWLIIDVAARYPSSNDFDHAYHVCGVLSSISLIMVNLISNSQIRGESYTEGCLGQTGAKAWLFIGFVIGFGALLGATWIVIVKGFESLALSMFLQNIFIFSSSMCFKFGRKEDLWSV